MNKNAIYKQALADDYISREAVLQALCDASTPMIADSGKPTFQVDYIQAVNSVPAADVVPAAAYNAAVDTIRKLLCSEYGDSCQFCVWHNIPDAHCARIGGSGGWCCENARWIGAEDSQPAGKLATSKQDRCKLPASYQQVDNGARVEV